ncbi:MAG TPA: hypothetical protein VMU26_04505 [Candidatus Polarisedimenticolia bacterium]|nr:hypothetical protein [Candidatus Polarisedimenticolia bacterium]
MEHREEAENFYRDFVTANKPKVLKSHRGSDNNANYRDQRWNRPNY